MSLSRFVMVILGSVTEKSFLIVITSLVLKAKDWRGDFSTRASTTTSVTASLS